MSDFAKKWETKINTREEESTTDDDEGTECRDDSSDDDYAECDLDEVVVPAMPAPTGLRRASEGNKRRNKRGPVMIGNGVEHRFEVDPSECESAWIKPRTDHKHPEVLFHFDMRPNKSFSNPGGYRHSDDIRNLDKKVEAEKAHISALALHECVLLDNNDMIFVKAPPEGAQRRIVRAIQPSQYEAAIAKSQDLARRWIVDSGCPLDLIGSDQLTVI